MQKPLSLRRLGNCTWAVVYVSCAVIACNQSPPHPHFWLSGKPSRVTNFYHYPGDRYPQCAVATYPISLDEYKPEDRDVYFGEALNRVRRDYGRAFHERRVIWDASKWNDDKSQALKDFDQVSKIVICLAPTDWDSTDTGRRYHQRQTTEWIIVAPVEDVFDECITIENLLKEYQPHQNAYHEDYDTNEHRFVLTIDPLDAADQ